MSRRKLATLIAAAAVAAGGAVAAVTAVGQGTAKPARHFRVGGRALSARDLAAASEYLGIPSAQLIVDLRAGKSLAEVANSTRGKSAHGLVAAIVSAKDRRLNVLASTVTKRVTAEVNRSGTGTALGGRHRGGFHALGASDRMASVAAGYLGTSPAHLLDQLRSGHTLAQVANATHGRSASGLIGALVAARREWLSEAVASHRVTRARASEIEARVLRRVTAAVNRSPNPNR